jgi:hypothetical protein
MAMTATAPSPLVTTEPLSIEMSPPTDCTVNPFEEFPVVSMVSLETDASPP